MKILLTTSIGTGPTKLAAFDDALCNTGIANYNLIKLSSIIPPNTKLSVVKGSVKNRLGEWGDRLYVVMAESRIDTPNQEAWAGIGWVINQNNGMGVFVEHDGSSEKSVRKDISDSLKSLLLRRPEIHGKQEMIVRGVLCKDKPVCVLAVAVYQSEGWKK